MSFEDILGYIAATLTTISFLPQVIKTWKSRSAEDISLAMVAISAAGSMAWLVYGFLKSDIPIIIANIILAALALMLVFMKFKFK